MILINSFFAKGFYTIWVFVAWENEKFLKIKKNHLFANILIIKILYKIILNQISRYITQLCTMSKSSRPEYYVNMMFLKISGNHLYQSLFFDKDVGWGLQFYYGTGGEIFKNICFVEHLQTAASECLSKYITLTIISLFLKLKNILEQCHVKISLFFSKHNFHLGWLNDMFYNN